MKNNVFSTIVTEYLFQSWIYYCLCGALALLVLLGILLISDTKRAVLGNRICAIAILSGIIITLVYYQILPEWLLYVSMAIGAIIGIAFAWKIKMIQVPQFVALLNGLGGLSSAVVAVLALHGIGSDVSVFSNSASGFALAIGLITFIGSIVAAGKLHQIIPQKPIATKWHTGITAFFLLITIALIILIAIPDLNVDINIFIALLIISSILFGAFVCVRIGGADMPITISLLNSLSGVAAAIVGLAILDVLLVAVGGIVGASGLLLTQIMCKGMNRSLLSIILGKTTSRQVVVKTSIEKAETTEVDFNDIVKDVKKVIIVPGYGMAIAQAQHLVKQLQDVLVARGAIVKYAIHPVAGRMPGHMNVLLCEANVDYEDLCEMEQINPEFAQADLTIVIGANDVINPAARSAEGSPIYGMPILDVDKCPKLVIFNYDLKPGYAGVENPLYCGNRGIYKILGDAKVTIEKVLKDLQK